jgi:hypothetical protein
VTFAELPASAAWRHHTARDGFETVFLRSDWNGFHVDGQTSAVEDGVAWAVRYRIELDDEWCTRAAYVRARSAGGERDQRLESDGAGHWRVNGEFVEELDGCLDVDLEASACTNTFPVHRLDLATGAAADAPAVYVRAVDVAVERLEQRYSRLDDADGRLRFHYVAPQFDYDDTLTYDASGLTLEYPALATRVS